MLFCDVRRFTSIFVAASLVSFVALAQAPASPSHFHPKGRGASQATAALQQEQRETLPFADQRDLEEQRRGFVAAPEHRQILGADGQVVWDIGQYEFLLEDGAGARGEGVDSIHPSLRRQAVLNMGYGLYQVTDRIWQVRGFDLANMTLIAGDTGWILFDVLTSKETAKAALEFANAQLGERPVKAVVFSHSHGDHFGGVRGVITEEQVRSGEVTLIASSGFLHHVFSENVYAGNAMTRRLTYQYAALMPASPYGPVDSAIGKRVSSGTVGVIQPNRIVEDDIEEITLDGVRMVFHNTPGTEAPAEMNTWFPDWKVLWMAENVTGTIHNIYTLRGALIRDALLWSKKINEALYRFGHSAEVMIASHNWPRWGNERIREVLRDQRDAYAHLNNQVLHLANDGVTVNQIHNVYEVPKTLQNKWHTRGYHGSFLHNSRGVLNRYLGYWDGNPATLVPLSPEDSAPLYVEMMGGAEKILPKAQELYDAGSYRHAQEILSKLVYAEPDNQAAKDLLGDVFEQLGYQYESPSLRNSFLAAALELRSGIPDIERPSTRSPDLLGAMPADLLFDFLATLVDADKAAGKELKIHFVMPDSSEPEAAESFLVELNNSTMTSIRVEEGFEIEGVDLTVTAARTALLGAVLGQVSIADLLGQGALQTEGALVAWQQLQSTFTQPDPLFEILPGTKSPGAD